MSSLTNIQRKITTEKWSTREQLCLVAAVSNFGNQNWLAISRCMKMLCGSNLRKHSDLDCYSNKNCAMEYERMLSDPEYGLEAVSTNNSPKISLKYDRLVDMRIQELTNKIKQGQEVSII